MHQLRLTGQLTRRTLASMTNLPSQIATTTEAFLATEGPRLADLCTACGACMRVCPFASHIGLDPEDAGPITDGLRKLARGAAGPEDTVRWAGACGKSGVCVDACPEKDRGLNAMLLVRIARQRAINDSKQLKSKADPTAFPRVKVFARLQLTDEELKKWL